MKKKEGFTLVELIVAIAIFMIVISMIVPLMSTITKSNSRTRELNELDLNIGKTLELFRRATRSSKPIDAGWDVTGSGIYLATDKTGATKSSSSATSSTAIIINVPKEKPVNSGSYVDEKVVFYYDLVKKAVIINSTDDTTDSNFSGVTGEVELVKNVMDARFGYEENIATIYMKIQLDKNDTTRFKEIRDAAVTRINIQF